MRLLLWSFFIRWSEWNSQCRLRFSFFCSFFFVHSSLFIFYFHLECGDVRRSAWCCQRWMAHLQILLMMVQKPTKTFLCYSGMTDDPRTFVLCLVMMHHRCCILFVVVVFWTFRPLESNFFEAFQTSPKDTSPTLRRTNPSDSVGRQRLAQLHKCTLLCEDGAKVILVKKTLFTFQT